MSHVARRSTIVSLAAVAGLAVPIALFAMDMKGMEAPAPKSASKGGAEVHQGTGVVKMVDTTASTVTLDHEPMKSMNWPAMTMAFKVQDKSMLNNLKSGSRVSFTLVKSGNDYVITSIK